MAEFEPSPRELDILKVLWEHGAGSVRAVRERLCPGGELAFNTVQTFLRIMEDKGLVGHRAEGRTFVYFPLCRREDVTARFLDRVYDGALDRVVLGLIEAHDAGPDELRDLERLIARARRAKQARPEGEGS